MSLPQSEVLTGGGASVPLATQSVSLEQMEAFLRQLSHDVRNDLSALDLLVSHAEDLLGTVPASQILEQIHGAVRYGSRRMTRLSNAFQVPDPVVFPYPVDVLFEDLRDRVGIMRPEIAARMQWELVEECPKVALDAVLVLEALTELLDNAASFSPSVASVLLKVENTESGVLWSIEQQALNAPGNMEEWGRLPLQSTRRGRYGLGLFRTRRILESLNVGLGFFFDEERLVLATRVLFPVEQA